jgi:hypothetical protein
MNDSLFNSIMIVFGEACGQWWRTSARGDAVAAIGGQGHRLAEELGRGAGGEGIEGLHVVPADVLGRGIGSIGQKSEGDLFIIR